MRSPRGTVYLIVDDTRRGFTSQEAFRSLGFVSDEIVDVTWEDLDAYIEGEPLTVETSYAQGTLLQDKTTGGVFYVENGEKHPIFSREILNNKFTNPDLTPVSSEDLESLERGDAVLFQDGTLTGVPGSPDVFVISEGMRRPIVDELTFYSFGWDWSQVVWTSERAVLEHPLGEPLELDTEFEDEIELQAHAPKGAVKLFHRSFNYFIGPLGPFLRMICFAAITPHTPLLIPGVGKENIVKLESTVAALKHLETELYASHPDVIVVISSHAIQHKEAFSLNLHDEYLIDFKDFGDLSTTRILEPDLALATAIEAHMQKHGVPFTLDSSASLDYGTGVPLFS